MARKPPDWQQPSLFPPDPADPTEPQDNATRKSQGDQHALQDHHSRASATTTADARAASAATEAAVGSGTLRQGAEEQPPSLEATPDADQATQRQESDRQRSTGNGAEGSGGSFAQRITAERQRGTNPRRGDAVSAPSYVARVKAS